MGQAGSKDPASLFVFCDQIDQESQSHQATISSPAATAATPSPAAAPAPECFVRRFVVPLHARADFDVQPESLVQGRVDVGCRCVTSALFRSQSIRNNTEIRLCFPPHPPHPAPPAKGGAGAENGTHGATATPSTPACVSQGFLCADEEQRGGEGVEGARMVTVAVSGGLVRELAPDEAAIAKRLRFALDTQLPFLSPTPCPPLRNPIPATTPAISSGDVGGKAIDDGGVNVRSAHQPAAGTGGREEREKESLQKREEREEESLQKRKQRQALESKLNR